MAILAAVCFALLLLVAFLLWDVRQQRREHAVQIERLCQRIQAPQSATALYEQERAAPDPPVVLPDDDEAWHQMHTPTREEMVAQLEAQAS